MGHRSSRMAPEHFVEEDTYSAWGSDIDESFCGPGKICADEWTPLNSRESSPEHLRRRLSVVTVEEEYVITEQPRGIEDDVPMNYDVLTIHDGNVEVPPLILAPIRSARTIPRTRRKVKTSKRRVLRKKKKQRDNSRFQDPAKPSTSANVIFVRSYSIPRNFHVPKNPNRRVIRIRRMRVRQDPRYPVIPPPGTNHNVKFRKCHPEDTFRFTKAVAPRHLKGLSVSPKPHFRYRGIRQIIV